MLFTQSLIRKSGDIDFSFFYILVYGEIKKDGRFDRLVLASILDNLDENMSKDKEEKELQFRLLSEGQIDYVKYVDGSTTVVYFKSEMYFKTYYAIKVVDVDKSKVWRLTEYDGSEGIEYYKGVEIVDKDLNMGEW